MQSDNDLQAERRAKLARLRGELSVQDRDITSAPSLTVVDEFSEEFSTADKCSGGPVKPGPSGAHAQHKIFYAEPGRPRREGRESDLEFNKLVNEANRRGGGRGTSINNFGSSSTFAEDTDLEDEALTMDSSLNSARSRSAGPARSEQRSLFNQCQADDNLKLSSSITKVYENGKYCNEDLGYQSSVSSPDQQKRLSTTEPAGLLKVERGVYTFSQSLPETFLKSVKTDLTQSLAHPTGGKAKSKVVYDPRIFGDGGADRRDEINDDRVEREYFERMNKMHTSGPEKSSFKQFLSENFRPNQVEQGGRRSNQQV